jgi:uncharacterized membrane protein YidH (DUF202 family)
MTTKAILLLLISLGIGYLVITFAKKEKRALKTIGYSLGAFIIAVSIVFIARYLWLYARSCRAIASQPLEAQYDLPKP